MLKTPLLIASLGLALVACKKDSKPADTKASDKTSDKAAAAKPTEVEAPKPSGPAFMADWDMTARKAAWQGAWAGEGNFLGDTAAWEVKGDDITFVNKKGEQKLKLAVDSPCTASFKSSDGSSWTTTYTLKDGQLVTGLGDAGSKKDDKAVVCGGGEVWVFDGKTCTDWANHFDRWESKPGECGFKKDDKGADVFFYKDMSGHETQDLVDGDVIWSEQMKNVHATKQADLAAAKTAQKL